MPDFTPAQQDAIEYLKRDACIVAGPGSGKTTVLVERFNQLVMRHGFDPGEILAITFTEKAAANMKEKLADQFRHSPERLRDLDSAWVSTIHGFCSRLLKEHAIAAGVDPRFEVLSPREADKLQGECLQRAFNELTALRRAETLELIEALQTPNLSGDLKSAYDAIRSSGMDVAEVVSMRGLVVPSRQIAAELREILLAWPVNITAKQGSEKARLLEWCLEYESAGETGFAAFLSLMNRLDLNLNRIPRGFSAAVREFRDELIREKAAAIDRHIAPYRAMILSVLTRFDEEYRKQKALRGRLDFNDLERCAVALLKNHAAVRSRIHTRFRQVMLDEFQDINGQQAELVKLLRAEHVFFGVGDRNQSIYGFRHARPEIFLEYHTEVMARAGQSVDLLHNFRSRDAILRCVEALLADAEGIDKRDLISGLNFAGKDEPSIEVLKIIDEAADKDAASDREAAWIAHRVHELCGTLQLGRPGETRAADFRDFAVLCRGGDSMTPILNAFDRAGIPYVSGRRQSYLLSREGLDIRALLSVIANPRDSISLAALLRGPFVGVSDDGLLRLRVLANSFTSGLNTFAFNPPLDFPEPDRARLIQFRDHLDRWRNDQPVIAPDLLLTRALADCGVNWNPASVIGANIESFIQLARTSGASMDLPAFLQEIESLAEAAGTESDLSDADQGNCVQVMTAHAAKGLEFPCTIIAAMDKGTRRESGPVTFTPEHGLGLKWRDPTSKDGKEGLKDSWAAANRIVLAERETREENRLLYVAMTRAEEHLILSYSCRKDRRPSNWAGRVDTHFHLHQAPRSIEPRREAHAGFDVSILVTDADPPPIARARTDAADAAVHMIARPVVNDQHEATVTVTSLAVFGACPRKYYIQRSLGWNSGRFRRFDPDDIAADDPEAEPEAEPEEADAASTGTDVHEILAGSAAPDSATEAGRLADVFFQSDLGKRAAASPRVAREWAFVCDIDGVIVRGSIDLWFEENGELYLVDYKTDDVKAAAAPLRAVEYAPQLALYAIALQRALGLRPRNAWLHFLRPNTLVAIPLDDAAVSAARGLITSLRQAQDQLRFDLNEGDHCRTCQFYKSLCPAGREGAL